MKVIVCDDHPSYLDATVQLLARAFEDVEILEADTLAKTIQLLHEQTPDMIVIDYSLPDTGNIGSIRNLVAEAKGIPVVVMSGVANPRDVQLCIEAGAKGFLPKSLSPKLFVSAVTIVADGGSYIPTDIIIAANQEPDIKIANFTERELEILEHLVTAAPNKEIAYRMGLQESSVKFYVSRIFRKLGAKNRVQAVNMAKDAGIVPD